MVKLVYEQACKLVERGILSYNTFIKVDIPSIYKKECYVNNVIIDEKKKIVWIDIIFQDIIPNNRKPFLIPHNHIISIGDMPIDKLLEAYDMGESNKIEEIDIQTDVVNEVIGKKEAIIDGIKLSEGKRFIFLNDITPKFNNRIYTVRFENEMIKLVANRGRPKKIHN